MGSAISYDAIIVGGGHNGLSAACYLATAGKKVLVVEAQSEIGGMAASSYSIPEAPYHLVHSCALDLMSMRVHQSIPVELELARHGFHQIELTPGYVYLHPDGTSLVFWRDPARTAAEIARYSQKDADSFLVFMQVIDAFLDLALPAMRADPAGKNLKVKLLSLVTAFRHRKLRPELMALITGSAYQAAVERFEHPVTISALCALTGAAGPITGDGTGIYYALLGFLHRFGVGRAVGGIQTLPNAMMARLKELDGEVLTGTAVEEIIAVEGTIKGVRLTDGRVLESRAVIAGCHPKAALEMVTGGAIERKLLTRIALAPANAHGASPLRIDLALSGQVSVPRHEALRADGLSLRGMVMLIGTAEAVLENFAAAARGEVATEPYLWIAVPSAPDPSQAPPGEDVVYLYPPAMPVRPKEGWDVIRAATVAQVIRQASDYVSGLQTLEIGRRVETSPDLAKRLNVHNGCVTHLDTTSLRSGRLRPAYGLGGECLPVAGLYLGGAGIHPGGGVNGMPGKIAASRALRFLGR